MGNGGLDAERRPRVFPLQQPMPPGSSSARTVCTSESGASDVQTLAALGAYGEPKPALHLGHHEAFFSLGKEGS